LESGKRSRLEFFVLRIWMDEFALEKVASKSVKNCPMPSAETVAKTLKDLWTICWDEAEEAVRN